MDKDTPGETESAFKVWKVLPEEAIMGEKCIVFTHVLMSLLTDHYGSICRREGCGRALQYRKTYVGHLPFGVLEMQCRTFWREIGSSANMQQY